jgi:hypothetical protein
MARTSLNGNEPAIGTGFQFRTFDDPRTNGFFVKTFLENRGVTVVIGIIRSFRKRRITPYGTSGTGKIRTKIWVDAERHDRGFPAPAEDGGFRQPVADGVRFRPFHRMAAG